jgi:hypothetical protein
MTTLSLSFRQEFNEGNTDEQPIVLVEITPSGATKPVRMSSEPISRLWFDESINRYVYGIRHLGNDYPWVVMSAGLPDDQQGKPPSTTLIFENVVEDMAATVRGVTPGTQADVVLKVVLSSAPDEIEERYVMKATNASYNATQVSLDISREPIESEPWPAFRMTKDRYPGLFR